MKKLINKPEDVVVEELKGIEYAHPDLVRVHYDPNFIYRADAPVQGKVAIVSGGGSGHEPMHGGFVGMGMLDAACPEVESVVTNDDVAVQDSLYTAGRRGVGVTVLAEKICGAAAEEGRSLSEVAEICRKVNGWGRSMGMALTSCTVPHAGKPTFDLPDDEMEIGIGIHGEPGRTRMKLKSADEITEMLMEPILNDLPFRAGDEVLLFVNSMGGTPLIELYVVYRKAYEIAVNAGLKVVRNLIGPYITSLEMAGCSITLLKMDDELIRLWDAPVKTPALRWGV